MELEGAQDFAQLPQTGRIAWQQAGSLGHMRQGLLQAPLLEQGHSQGALVQRLSWLQSHSSLQVENASI